MGLPPEPDSTDLARYTARARAAQLQNMPGRIRAVVFVDLVFANCLIVGLLWDLPALSIVAWVVAHSAVDCLALYSSRLARRFLVAAILRNASIALTSASLLLGLFWGAFAVNFYGFSSEWLHVSNTFLWVACLCVLATTLLGDHLPSLVAFVFSSMTMLVARAFAADERNQFFLGLVGLLGVGVLYWVGRSRSQALTHSLIMSYSVKDMAAELAEQRDAATRANVAKSKFIAAASHDLRQPLHALALLATSLEGQKSLENVQGISRDIQRSVGSLEKMFSALLDISRLDAGVLRPNRRHFDLDELLGRVCSELALQAQQKGMRLIYRPDSLVAFSDPLLIERVVRNFVTNGIRYGEVGDITVVASQVDATIRVEVHDSGPGIPADQCDAIFDEFVQLANPERDKEKGFGLGLAIVRRIGELLEHRVGVEPRVQGGSCFFVVIPSGKREDIVSTPTVNNSEVDLNGLRVAVIEDDVAIREGMRKLLTMWDCRFLIAENAMEAIAEIGTALGTVDAVIADYRLRQNRTGIEAAELLREEFGSRLPVLIVSGDTAPELLREVASRGFTLVHKPVQLPVLKAFLAHANRKRKAQALKNSETC